MTATDAKPTAPPQPDPIDAEVERPKFEAAMLAEGKFYSNRQGVWAWPAYSYTDLFLGWLAAKRDADKSAVPAQEG